MTWYLGVTTTRQIRPFPGADKCRGEFAVQKQLEAMGIESHVPYKIGFTRSGKQRYAEPTTEVLMPNYIFADIPAHMYATAMGCNGLARTMQAVHPSEVQRQLQPFFAKCEDNNAEAMRIIEAGDRAAMCQFNPGDPLEILSGPFKGMIAEFGRMVQSARDPWPMVEGEAQILGQAVKIKADVLDVREAQKA
jgi:transcription antitermination factor NusG